MTRDDDQCLKMKMKRKTTIYFQEVIYAICSEAKGVFPGGWLSH
jgi:hypothetical protein